MLVRIKEPEQLPPVCRRVRLLQDLARVYGTSQIERVRRLQIRDMAYLLFRVYSIFCVRIKCRRRSLLRLLHIICECAEQP